MSMRCWLVCVPQVFPFHEAEQVLREFWKQFIDGMAAENVLWDLLDMDIIDEGNLRTLTETKNTEQQNKMLHLCLKEKCTLEALKTVCEVIIDVKGNPKMRALGEDMKRRLKEAGVCVCVSNCLPACMPVSVCVRMCVCVCARVRVVGGVHRAYICISSCDCGTTVERVYFLKIRTCNNCYVLLPHLYVFDIRTMISFSC